MMTLEGGEKTPQQSPHGPAWEMAPIAASALRERRGDRSQIEIARAAGISQGFLSELESGRKRLTPSVAQRLAPVFGMPANQLMFDEHLATLNRVAAAGAMDAVL
jgi:transcriptional regulator with XRE-family HTH domain